MDRSMAGRVCGRARAHVTLAQFGKTIYGARLMAVSLFNIIS